MNKLIITIEQMQGNACGMKCLKVVEDNGTTYGKTLGFIVPIQYNFRGYWGGCTYYVCSFNHPDNEKAEKACLTLYDVAIHLGVDPDKFAEALPYDKTAPYYQQWEYINTRFV